MPLTLIRLRVHLQEFQGLVRQLDQTARSKLRLICTSRRTLGANLPECELVQLGQLALSAGVQALCHYSNGPSITTEHQHQLVDLVCRRNPFALSIIGPLLRDNPSRAQVSCELNSPASALQLAREFPTCLHTVASVMAGLQVIKEPCWHELLLASSLEFAGLCVGLNI